MEKKIFKYNMTLYYQSLVIYGLVLIAYILLRIQFVGFQSEVIIRDPIFYFFLIMILYTFLGTMFNLIRKKNIEIFPDGFAIQTRFRKKVYTLDDILGLNIKRENKFHFQGVFRTIKIKTKSRPYPLIVRPFDYDDENEMLNEFRKLRALIEARTNKTVKKNV